MADDVGQNESFTLENGEIIYLVREPYAKWRIRSYECNQNVCFAEAGGMVFEHLQGLPQEWKDKEFESIDAAAKFSQKQITLRKVPRNSE